MSRLLAGFKWQSASFFLASAIGAATGSFILLHYYFRHNLKINGKKKKRKLSDGDNNSQHSTKETEFLPPLPDPVVQLLRSSKLCFLATHFGGEPHLSLMNFTYWHKGDAIILCTRRNTKKFEQICKNSRVAVLVHDFPHLHSPGFDEDIHTKSWSITLNGSCTIFEPGNEEGEKLREIHLKNNPDYSQFIKGDDIAVMKVEVERARMCDINDRVCFWSAKDGFSETV